MHTPLAFENTVSPSLSLVTDADPEDPLIAMADPAFDSRIAIVSPGALDVTCALIRHGYQTASVFRLDDRARRHQADVVIIPEALSCGFIERAVPFAQRLLAPMGVVVLRLAADRDDGLALFARRQLMLNGFTAVRVRTVRGETLLGAELPLHGRLACA